MVSLRDYEIYLLFFLLVKFHGSGKCEIYSLVQKILQFFYTMCHFELRNRKHRSFISDRDVCQNDSPSPRWLLAVFVFQNFDMIWGLSDYNYDAIEVKSKGFYVSSVKIPYVQNITSTLKLRSALFS